VTVSFTADEEVREWLESRENKSEAIREAIRDQMGESGESGESGDSGLSSLSEEQRDAYEMARSLCRDTDAAGAVGRIDGEVLKSELAQQNGVSKDAVWRLIVSPLIRDGWFSSSWGSSLLVHSEPVERDSRDAASKPLSDRQKRTGASKDCSEPGQSHIVVAGRCQLCGQFIDREADESEGVES